MLSSSQARSLAAVLIDRLGSAGIAAAMLRAQEAEKRGDLIEMSDWRRVAAQAVRRMAERDPRFILERDRTAPLH